jgi:hypothetical protein
MVIEFARLQYWTVQGGETRVTIMVNGDERVLILDEGQMLTLNGGKVILTIGEAENVIRAAWPNLQSRLESFLSHHLERLQHDKEFKLHSVS